MHLVLVPGLLLAMAASLAGVPAQPNVGAPHTGGNATGSLFSIAAQATTTATLTTTTEVSATATISGSVQSTPVPLPVQGGGVPLQSNPFDPAHLFSTAPREAAIGPYAWAFLALMTALLAASGYFMLLKRPEWKRTNSVQYRAANRWGQVGLWLAIPGIFLLLFRVVGLDFFNMRFWLYLWTLATLAAAGWFFYWYRTIYPKEMAKYQKTQRARQYMPGSASKTMARQVVQTKSKGAVAASGGAGNTQASGDTTVTASPPVGQSRSRQKGNKRGKRK
jgi:hypothetical protein